ncbi:hypothetical protein BGZ99_005345 [Dissophora globulifera]|uniref:Uncharacterized protein n=1 Tax=Dissophora globulifera TaxID=979702 RepID=A0A9P6RK37_9FUNG|nr:hypothetical protein BGZ99_005345 [Dissophora globulifera]
MSQNKTIPLADFSSGTPEMTLREEVLIEHMRGQERKLLQHAELIEILYEEKHKLMERQVQLEADLDKAVKSLEAANVELKKIQKREDWLEEMLEKTIEEKDLTDKRFEASKECIEEHLAAIRILTARSEKAREREEKATDESNVLTLRLIAMESQRNRLAKDLQAMEAEIVSLSKENLDMRVVNEQLIYEQQLGAASIDNPITEHPSILSETYQQSLWEELNKGVPWSDTAVDPATVPLPEDYQNDSDGSSTLGTALSASSGHYRSAAFSDNDSEGRGGDGGCRSLTSSAAVAASSSAPIATPQDPALQQPSSDLWAEVTALIESRLGVFEPDFHAEFRDFKQSIKEAQERATQELRRDFQEFVQVNSVQQSESVRATEQRMGADLDAVQRQVSLKLEAMHQQLNDTVCNAITQSKRDGNDDDKRNNHNDRITNNNTRTKIYVIAGGTLFTIALITILRTPEAFGIHRSGLPSVLHQISTCVSMRTGFLWLFHAPWCAFGEFLYYMAWDTVQSVASPN